MAAKKTKKLSKSDFVRAQPKAMPAADVVAKGKASGLKFTSALVYKVRNKGKAKRSTPKAPAKKTSATAKPAQSKAAFIRSLPRTMPVKDVVAEAKKHGMTIPETYVYWARSTGKGPAKAKTTKRAARSARSATPRKAPAVTRPITTRTSAEDLLRAVAAEIGLGRAIELLEAERARVHAVLRG